MVSHRDPFLFVDRITHVAPLPGPATAHPSEASGIIVAAYDLRRAESVLRGHFPGSPLWPGVLQVEAVGQAGLCLLRLLDGRAAAEDAPACALTDILAARYLRPVVPPGEVEIVARTVRDGLYLIVVGQCLKEGLVCSAAAVRGIEKEVHV
jgi:3-hydroxymyristoyl/3-hydroxydecanoyl-(acyl carrier protein) dehydratase